MYTVFIITEPIGYSRKQTNKQTNKQVMMLSLGIHARNTVFLADGAKV